MDINVTPKQVAGYVFLPQIASRFSGLKLNLGWFAYLMALIFRATRILPPNSPYLMRDRQGRYGVVDILAEAARHLKKGVRYTDQYIIYAAFVLGTVLLLGQFILLFFIVATHAAEAAIPWVGMFNTPIRQDDLALMMLDKVFEIPEFFGSRFDPDISGTLTPFGAGLHQLFAFYNYGMLMVAGMIFLYFIFAVTIETMQTGSPFGQRFKEIFVPFRIVIAVFLLVPLGYGFSAGQYLVFKLADWGSGFATNGWLLFNQAAKSNPLGVEADQLLVMPKIQEVEDLLRFYSLVHSCRAIYDEAYDKDIQPYIVSFRENPPVSVSAVSMDITTAIDYFPDNNIKIIYGEKNDSHTRFPGKVKPYCGSIDVATANSDKEGALLLESTYWDFLQLLWDNTNLRSYGARRARNYMGREGADSFSVTVAGWDDADHDPDVGFYGNMRADIQAIFNSQIESVRDEIRDLPESSMPMTEELLKRGWGGAGIWFNQIAEYNGAIMSANMSMPVPSSYPAAMQALSNAKGVHQTGLSTLTRFNPGFGGDATLKDSISANALDDPGQDASIASFLGGTYTRLSEDDVYGDGTEGHDKNVIADMFNAIFGTYGLSELRGNQEIHPLAKMSALGRGIIDRAIVYIGGAMVMGGLSGFASMLEAGAHIQAGASAAFGGVSSMFVAFATIAITVGVVLYYVIPFLPFLYFFFAVGRWVKSIFEAVVGVPLWALAHLRIDGEGIPGPAAANGYYLLLEIMLRPILVIFGLMASISCFSALAIGLDSLFDLVVRNVTGYTPIDETGTYSWKAIEFKRGHVDQFFYTVVYAILLYMMALSCFKLIDLIPNSVLRFLGTQVSEFNDQLDIERETVQYTGMGSYYLADDFGSIAKQSGEIGGKVAGSPVGMTGDFSAAMQRMGFDLKPPPSAPGPG